VVLGRRGQPEPRQDPRLEPGRRLGGRQQLEQLIAGGHQLPHVLAAAIACFQMRDRPGSLAPG
jgi:hypothetical protein